MIARVSAMVRGSSSWFFSQSNMSGWISRFIVQSSLESSLGLVQWVQPRTMDWLRAALRESFPSNWRQRTKNLNSNMYKIIVHVSDMRSTLLHLLLGQFETSKTTPLQGSGLPSPLRTRNQNWDQCFHHVLKENTWVWQDVKKLPHPLTASSCCGPAAPLALVASLLSTCRAPSTAKSLKHIESMHLVGDRFLKKLGFWWALVQNVIIQHNVSFNRFLLQIVAGSLRMLLTCILVISSSRAPILSGMEVIWWHFTFQLAHWGYGRNERNHC